MITLKCKKCGKDYPMDKSGYDRFICDDCHYKLTLKEEIKNLCSDYDLILGDIQLNEETKSYDDYKGKVLKFIVQDKFNRFISLEIFLDKKEIILGNNDDIDSFYSDDKCMIVLDMKFMYDLYNLLFKGIATEKRFLNGVVV